MQECKYFLYNRWDCFAECQPNCTRFFMILVKKLYAHVREFGCPSRESMHCNPSSEQCLAVRNIPHFNLFRSPPFPSFHSRRGAERWDHKSLPRLHPPSVSLMDVRCVWEDAVAWVRFMLVLSMMSREAAGDEQKPPWPALQYLHFLFYPSKEMFPCFSWSNILVLIKPNKGKHSVMGEEREIFWFPGEPDSSALLLLTINLVAVSVVGWPCPVLTFPRVDYKGVQAQQLCYCLQPWCLSDSAALQSPGLSYNINLDLGWNVLFNKAISA